MRNPEGFPIVSEKDISRILHPAEQQFALLLLRHPHLEVAYAPEIFTGTQLREGRDGIEEVSIATVPDFSIKNTNNSKSPPKLVEITQHSKLKPVERNGKIIFVDPKQRQQDVMAQADYEGEYIILRKEHLKRIQEHTGFPMFNAKRVRPKKFHRLVSKRPAEPALIRKRA